MTELEKFRQKFRIPAYTVREYQHWVWSLRPVHTTIGCGVLSLRRYCPHFGEMTPDEGAELAYVAKELEAKLKAAFQFDKINYLMLMMLDPHVHFHVIPRYATPREFGGIAWTDEAWPKPPNSAAGRDLSESEAKAIVAHVLGA
ncbi:MAG: HIT family protein [Alphaproteobacteria bacterium]|nr:HIT family protein [Alphaproteobacteria bacterium]